MKYVTCVAFSPDGKRLLTCHWGGVAWLWSVETREPVGEPFRVSTTVWSGTFSPDGDLLALGSNSSNSHLWVASSGENLGAAIATDEWYDTAAFSSDGKRLLVGGPGGFKIWDISEPPKSLREMELRTWVSLGTQLQ